MPYPILLLPPFTAFSLPLSLSLSLPLSHCVLGSLSLSLSYHLFSLPGLGSFYCLKGTLLTTHICPFIILRGLFYSCPSTVADVDQCLAMLNRSEKASAGQRMHGGVREAHPCQFCNRKYVEEGERKEDRGEKGIWRSVEWDKSKREQMAVAKRIQKKKKERDRDPKGNKEWCSEGDRSCRLGQGIMVLLHF